MEIAPLRSRRAPAPAPVPLSCYLCRSDRLVLRFAARGQPSGDPCAYACTSFGHHSHPPIWGCRECGLLFQWPLPDPADLVSSYAAVEDPLYTAEKENRYLTFRRVLRLLGPGRGRALLDVGAYCGYFLDVAREGGYSPEGLELSRWAAVQARALGFVVRNETLAERARSGAAYDVLTLWDVVEHFADPAAELEAAYRLLRRGGRLYVSTIDARSLVARALGHRWPWLMEMHLFYFDRRTLPRLLREIGFEVYDRRAYTHTVSAGYLLRKLAASFPQLGPALSAVRRIVPAQYPVPVNLGDNMVITAVKR